MNILNVSNLKRARLHRPTPTRQLGRASPPTSHCIEDHQHSWIYLFIIPLPFIIQRPSAITTYLSNQSVRQPASEPFIQFHQPSTGQPATHHPSAAMCSYIVTIQLNQAFRIQIRRICLHNWQINTSFFFVSILMVDFFWFWENLSFCTRRSVNGCNPAAYFGGKIIEYFVNRLVYWKERNGSVSEILMEEYWSETIPKRIMEGESSVDWGRWELGIDMVWWMGMVLKVVVANFMLDNDGAETMVEEFGQWFWIL